VFDQSVWPFSPGAAPMRATGPDARFIFPDDGSNLNSSSAPGELGSRPRRTTRRNRPSADHRAAS
jgi:hypothetical protein